MQDRPVEVEAQVTARVLAELKVKLSLLQTELKEIELLKVQNRYLREKL